MEVESNTTTTKEVSLSAWGECIEGLQELIQKGLGTSQSCVDSVRNLTAKLLALCTGQGKARKLFTSQVSPSFPVLVSLLKYSQDVHMVHNVILVLKDLLYSKADRDERSSLLVSHGAVQYLLQAVLCANEQEYKREDFWAAMYTVLTRLGSQDRKFATKVRLSGALQVIVQHLRVYGQKETVGQPLLLLLKRLLTSSVNASLLGREGIVEMLMSIINARQKRKTSLGTIYALEDLSAVCLSKQSIMRLVDNNGISELLQLLHHHSSSLRGEKVLKRQLRICKALLLTFLNVAFTKQGRHALNESKVVPELLAWCHSLTSTDPQVDHLVELSSLVMQRCLPPLPLPVPSGQSPVTFSLPLDVASVHSLNNSSHKDDDSDQDSLDCQSSEDDDPDSEDVKDDSLGDRNKTPHLKKEHMDSYLKYFAELNDNSKSEVVSRESSITNSDIELTETIPSDSVFYDDTQPLDAPNSKGLSNLLQCLCIKDAVREDRLLDGGDPDSMQRTGHCQLFFPREQRQPISNCDSRNGKIVTKDEEVVRNDVSVNITISDVKHLLSSAREVHRGEQFLKNLNVSNAYTSASRQTKSVNTFVKLAYPELKGSPGYDKLEKFHNSPPGTMRSKLLSHIEHRLQSAKQESIVVYDLDSLIRHRGSSGNIKDTMQHLTNNDEERVQESKVGPELKFESRFESGNLRKAIKVGDYTYDLVLNSDINNTGHNQWFYFEVSGMEAGVPYTFNIINCEKQSSLISSGMCPVMFSVKDAKPCWMRVGQDVCYFKNHYVLGSTISAILKGKHFYTLSFTITFPHVGDVCYFAYHYPYPYSLLQTHLYIWENMYDTTTVYFNKQQLCSTLAGNYVPVLTITSKPVDSSRPYVFLTSRVHPGETNSSWIMKGVLDFLLSSKSSAQRLREAYIFKIVPMLNPDGVINGCTRTSLTGQDLNRQWMKPNSELHPIIFNTKSLIHYLCNIGRKPLVFCDFHGHSRRKNVFLYGCSPRLSWYSGDREKPDDQTYEVLPLLLHQIAPAFSLENCSFAVEKNRETTARVTVWREFGIPLSYTMECSYGGCDQGLYAGHHLGIPQLEEMGAKFCQSLGKLHSDAKDTSDFSFLLSSIQRFTQEAPEPLYTGLSDGSRISTSSQSDEEGEAEKLPEEHTV